MAEIRRRGARIHLTLPATERDALQGILDRLSPSVGVVAGSAPVAYADAELQAEYAKWVAPDVQRSREADLDVLRDSLTAGEDVTTLTDAQALAWIRALNHLRLTAAGLAGVEDEQWEQALESRATPELRILVALGILQEELVAAIEG
jgi:hypothetical protein